jgi:signal transduction histidine kinase
MVAVLLAVITLFHYGTDIAMAAPHTVYRRLYYIPIVLAAFLGGLAPGLVTASLAALLYLPHAFLLHHHIDPAPPVDKVMEMVLYLGVGGLSGLLVDRERAAREREAQAALERTAAESTAQRLSGLVHLSRGLAHEIRNPLGGIQGAIEILAEDVPKDSPRREMVTVALRETERLNRVLSDFLDFARPRDPEAQPFVAVDVARHVAALLEPEGDKVGVSVASTPKGSALSAYADPQQVTQVLVNLARNAIQATPPGGRVELSVERVVDKPGSPPMVAFEVADTGAGVPSELGDAIYDPYVSGREGGTGLGLGLCALLARQNAGTLTHRAKSGGGTVFRFTIPATVGEGT